MKTPSQSVLDIASAATRAQGRNVVDSADMFRALLTYLDQEAEKQKPEPVICPECTASGTKSKIVHAGRGGATMDVYFKPIIVFDEDGREHHHAAALANALAGLRSALRGMAATWREQGQRIDARGTEGRLGGALIACADELHAAASPPCDPAPVRLYRNLGSGDPWGMQPSAPIEASHYIERNGESLIVAGVEVGYEHNSEWTEEIPLSAIRKLLAAP